MSRIHLLLGGLALTLMAGACSSSSEGPANITTESASPERSVDDQEPSTGSSTGDTGADDNAAGRADESTAAVTTVPTEVPASSDASPPATTESGGADDPAAPSSTEPALQVAADDVDCDALAHLMGEVERYEGVDLLDPDAARASFEAMDKAFEATSRFGDGPVRDIIDVVYADWSTAREIFAEADYNILLVDEEKFAQLLADPSYAERVEGNVRVLVGLAGDVCGIDTSGIDIATEVPGGSADATPAFDPAPYLAQLPASGPGLVVLYEGTVHTLTDGECVPESDDPDLLRAQFGAADEEFSLVVDTTGTRPYANSMAWISQGSARTGQIEARVDSATATGTFHGSRFEGAFRCG